MKTAGLVAVSALLCSLGAAVPLQDKRSLVTSTVLDVKIETAYVTTTIYADAAAASATPSAKPQPDASYQELPKQPVQAQAAVADPAPKPAPTTEVPVTTAPAATTPPATPTPAPSSSQPAPSSEPAPSQSVAPAPPSGSGSTAISLSGPCDAANPCTGDLTWYEVGLGSCGTTNSGTEDVVALSKDLMGSVSNGNPMCGRKITISLNGKTKTATVVDKCGDCKYGSVDLSKSLYDAFGFDGRAPGATWSFL
ncbi:MAG: hypothetical protein M1832_002986 [Thelocarpon impressellum]|nr:MAG: hypothetical protein M1832_002986 [Thelocarpon impressellum]